MNAVEIISHLRKLDMRVWVDGDRLRYSAPDGVMTPALRAELAEHKAEILAFLRGAEAAVKPAAPSILPVARNGEAPLSSVNPLSMDELDQLYQGSNLTRNQLLIWTGQKLRPDAPIYNAALSFVIQGQISPENFQGAFQTLVNSSDALRTVIEERDGVPRQLVIPDLPYAVEYLDLSQKVDPEAEFDSWMYQRLIAPFDFAKRLFDTALIKLSDGKFAWYLNQHHIICDHQSIWLIFQRMSEFYGRALEGRLEEKVELPAFQDYLDYEREYRSSARYLKSRAYWERKLADEPEPIAFYGKASHKPTTRIQQATYNLDLERTRKLKDLALSADVFVKTEKASLFNVLAAVLGVILYHISGSRRFSLGVASHNRRSKAFAETIGLLMEVHPLYLTIADDDTFLSLVKKVAVEARETLQHSEFIISKKAYDVFLNYRAAIYPEFHGAPVQLKRIHSGHETDSLTLNLREDAFTGTFVLDFDFHCDVFNEGQRSHTVQCFLKILDSFLEDRTQSIDRVDLLSANDISRGPGHR
jgi:Condensation domain/TubC N-terminal docking domain